MPNGIAAIWARVSSEGQKELSRDGQVDRVRTKLTAEGYSVPPEYIFKVIWTSLDLESCSEFQTLKTLIRTKKINAVGFLDRDRIEAVSLQRLLFLSECRENNVEPIVCQGAPFMTEPEGQLVEMALALGKERSVLRAQSGAKQGLEDRVKKKGLPPTMRPPYGYIWEKNKLIANMEIDNARLIWDLALKGMKIKEICHKLTDMGIPTSRGNSQWQPSSLIAILKNLTYTGRIATLKYSRIEPIERRKGTFGKTSVKVKPADQWHYLEGLVNEPIVSQDQFNAVQDRLTLNKENASRNAKRNYLLRGLIECQICHRKYYGIQRKGQKPGYVCCGAWAQMYGKKCQAKSICCHTLEDAVKVRVRNFLEHSDTYMDQAKGKILDFERTKSNLEQTILGLENELKDNIFQEQKALRLLSEQAFISEQKTLFNRRTWLQEEITRQKVKLGNLEKKAVNAESIEMMRKRLESNLDKATDEDWRFIFETLKVKVFMFGDGTWDIEINVPIVNNKPWYISLQRHPGLHPLPAAGERCCRPHWPIHRQKGRWHGPGPGE